MTCFGVVMARVPLSPRTRELVARVGATARHQPDADRTELIRELRAARAEDWARDIAASAPPLTNAQRARVAAIILAGKS